MKRSEAVEKFAKILHLKWRDEFAGIPLDHVADSLFLDIQLILGDMLPDWDKEADGYEVCKRCQKNGPDRRTLSVDCLWDISSMGIPFEKQKGNPYVMRICKDCRRDFLMGLTSWWGRRLDDQK